MADMMQGYVDVAERLRDLRVKHPDASLQPVDPARPFWFEQVDGNTFLVYAAACYRTPDDPTPGVGLAWEPVPGRTSFTRGSELQNAETSAWGRAIVAALAADTKRGIASQQEVEAARRNATDTPARKPAPKPSSVKPDPRLTAVAEQVKQLDDHSRTEFKALFGDKPSAITDPAAALAWLASRVEPF
jgi:hypothetical protein